MQIGQSQKVHAEVLDAGDVPTPSPAGHPASICGQVALICGLILMLLGGAVLAGWLMEYEPLMTVLPGRVRMKPNAAVGFIFSGLALFLGFQPSPGRLRLRRKVSLVSVACGYSALLEYTFRTDLRIDQALFLDTIQPIFPGRMAEISAANFVLAGLALYFSSMGPVGRSAARWMAGAIGALAFVAIIGYGYGVPVLYGSAGYTAMALHTGAGFLVLAAGILFSDADSTAVALLCTRHREGWLVRRLLAGVVLIPVALGWVYMQPSVNFGRPAFGMALFAVTLVAVGLATLHYIVGFLNREEASRQLEVRAREEKWQMEVDGQRLKEAQRESEERLRLALAAVKDMGTFDWDLATGRLYADARLSRIFGVVAEQCRAGTPLENVLSRIHPEDRDRVEQGLNASLRTGQDYAIDYRVQANNTIRWVTMRGACTLDEAGTVVRLPGVILDITERKLTDQALIQNEKLAAVGRLASSIAHEINNPLESVTNLIYLARTSETLEDTREYLDAADSELRRASAITNETLRFHKQSTSPSPVTFEALAGSVLTVHQSRIVNSKIAVEKRQRTHKAVLCFDGEIRQVISNLVGNAIDAMHPEGGRLILRSREGHDWKTGDPSLIVTVADTGPGMSQETLDKVFEAFFTTKGIGGTGLGLWISKDILARHRGRLAVRSSKRHDHHGTVFAMYLPFQAASR